MRVRGCLSRARVGHGAANVVRSANALVLGMKAEGHGTGMASLIVGQGPGTGFLGISPKVKILPIVANTGSTIAAGIRDAVDRGVRVINVSQTAWAD